MSKTTEQALAIPFRILPNGAVDVTTDPRKIWNDRVVAVLGTAVGERIRRHDFGSEVHQELFNTVTGSIDGIERAIDKAFTSHLPLLTFERMTSDFDRYSNTLSITVFYDLPNEEQSQTSIANISLNGSALSKEF
jgi:phage baseplate assembly protein W